MDSYSIVIERYSGAWESRLRLLIWQRPTFYMRSTLALNYIPLNCLYDMMEISFNLAVSVRVKYPVIRMKHRPLRENHPPGVESGGKTTAQGNPDVRHGVITIDGEGN